MDHDEPPVPGRVRGRERRCGRPDTGAGAALREIRPPSAIEGSTGDDTVRARRGLGRDPAPGRRAARRAPWRRRTRASSPAASADLRQLGLVERLVDHGQPPLDRGPIGLRGIEVLEVVERLPIHLDDEHGGLARVRIGCRVPARGGRRRSPPRRGARPPARSRCGSPGHRRIPPRSRAATTAAATPAGIPRRMRVTT